MAASLLVASAWTGERPATSSAGSCSRPPPPTTASTHPAPAAATRSRTICSTDTSTPPNRPNYRYEVICGKRCASYRSDARRRALPAGEDIVDQAVAPGLLGGHEQVALDVLADLQHRPAGMPGQDLLLLVAHPQDLPRLDLQVAGLPTPALGGGLVEQDPRVRQRRPFARSARRQQHGRRRGGLADADGLDLGPDEPHRVVDRGHRGEGAARRVDVQVDVAVGVERLQGEQLGHHVVGRGVVDLGADEDDPVLEELVVGIHLPHPVGGALGEGGQDVPGGHRLAPFETWAVLATIWSMNPYALASSAVNHRSRSESAWTRSSG